MRDRLLIYLNGRRLELPAESLFQPLSDFLRNDRGLTGTKVVCAEGDCGSCTVLIGRLDRVDDGDIYYQSVCSCIAYLFQLDCTHIVTVEGLTPDEKLNPVQDAMMKCHGAQCGFCTPGFVVSICGMMEMQTVRNDARVNIRRELSGNLCRCTGYEAILNAIARVDASEVRKIESLFPAESIRADLSLTDTQELSASYDGREFYKPTTVAHAVAFRAAHPDCTIVAGGTDLGVVMNKGLRQPRTFLSLAAIEELCVINIHGNSIVVGANATLSLLAEFSETFLPEFAKMLWRHGSPLTRNAGTLAGNIANGSPIGDTMPGLFVLNALIEVTGPGGARSININDFYTGYRQLAMKPDELITRVFIPIPADNEIFKLYKVSKRQELDISSFTAAFWMKVEKDTITAARVALGGVAATIVRLPQTEAMLEGESFSESTLISAGDAASGEIAPISDVRGSADYRLTLARNIFQRLWFDLHPDEPALASTNGNGEVHRDTD